MSVAEIGGANRLLLPMSSQREKKESAGTSSISTSTSSKWGTSTSSRRR